MLNFASNDQRYVKEKLILSESVSLHGEIKENKYRGVILKATGMVRKIDQLGRIVIPKDIIKMLNVKANSTLFEVKIEDEKIILEKYVPGRACAITGEITPENKVYEGDICLSPKGAFILFQQLVEDNWDRVKKERLRS